MSEPLTEPVKGPVDADQVIKAATDAELAAHAPPPDAPPEELKVTAAPTGMHARLFRLEVSERELQCVSNGLAAFFNVMSRQKTMINPLQAEAILSFLTKAKQAIDKGEIKVVATGVDFEGMTK